MTDARLGDIIRARGIDGVIVAPLPARAHARLRNRQWLELDSILGTSGSMKTTVNLPEEEIEEAMRHTKAKTKTEAVSLAVADYNRRQRLARLADRLGTFRDMMTRADLEKMREAR